jgi:Trp operon repressor
MKNGWEKEMLGLIRSARDAAELKELLSALLTPQEYKELINRWQIVKRLIKGETQRKIRDSLNVSIATVTRGAREVKYGSGIFHRLYDRVLRV